MMDMCFNMKEGQWERKRREGEETKRAGGAITGEDITDHVLSVGTQNLIRSLLMTGSEESFRGYYDQTY